MMQRQQPACVRTVIVATVAVVAIVMSQVLRKNLKRTGEETNRRASLLVFGSFAVVQIAATN